MTHFSNSFVDSKIAPKVQNEGLVLTYLRRLQIKMRGMFNLRVDRLLPLFDASPEEVAIGALK